MNFIRGYSDHRKVAVDEKHVIAEPDLIALWFRWSRQPF